jgi:alginate O-acetyltransferase complex protein AlgI
VTFNSYQFLLVFLPVVVAGFYVLSRVFSTQKPALAWLVLASVVFYGSFGLGYLVVLVASVAVNFLIARAMSRLDPERPARRWLLTVGVLANLALLASYKYTGFLAENINALLGTHLAAPTKAYPIGLSFYTFIQIGFLLDAYVGQTEKVSFLRYSLFGTFFPYITAGPIVRQKEVLEQLTTPVKQRTGVVPVVVGLTMFGMGLFKKVVLADSIAPYATMAFDTAASGAPMSTLNAWIGAVAYTLQIYFDFSGYTDMAIGIGYMVGLRLPANFNSPLRATSMVDFWRRWHITMTRFFTNYIYTPITMRLMRRAVRTKSSEPVRVLTVLALPIVLTFLLVGLWHGAGWGFVVWGAIQGVALAVNLVWRELAAKHKLPAVPSVVGWALTMLTFVFSLLFFRATSVGTALDMAGIMLGNGAAGAPDTAQFFGTKAVGAFTYTPAVTWLVLLLAIALFFPRNTQELLAEHRVALDVMPSQQLRPWLPLASRPLAWHPNLRWAVAMAFVIGLALVFAGGPSPFLYYQF